MPFANDTTGNPHAYLVTAHICGQPFAIDHALICPTRGYPTIRHNELRDFTATAMSEVCYDVCLEPPRQTFTGDPCYSNH